MYEPYQITHGQLRPMKPSDVYKKYTKRYMRSDVILPSEHHAYSVCVEFAKEWFLSKFPEHFFKSVYVDGTHSFDEFRKFSDIDQKLRRTNPLLAIVPVIDHEHNRSWVDSNPEMPMALRRTRIEGSFLNDIRDNRGLHLQLQFKTILMKFTYKLRLDTRAQQLDMMQFIKLNHRAGWTETANLDLDIHVPNRIISQIAFDNAIPIDEDGNVLDKVAMLKYLNTYSLIPFLYKLRAATGNGEYFIKVPNCVAHIKSDLPTADDGNRTDMTTTDYQIEFNIEVEMTAPYCYTYYSQKEIMKYINRPAIDSFGDAIIEKSIMTEFPREDENHWALLTTTEYEVDDEDLKKPLEIDFREFFAGSDIQRIMEYTRSIAVCPDVFLHIIMFNGGIELGYDIDWVTTKAVTHESITHNRTMIGVYVDQKYVNETIMFLDSLKNNPSRIN